MVVEQTAITDPKTRTDSVKGPARSTHTVTLQYILSLLAIVKAYLFNAIIEVSLVNVRMYTYNQGVATLGFGLPHPKLNPSCPVWWALKLILTHE